MEILRDLNYFLFYRKYIKKKYIRERKRERNEYTSISKIGLIIFHVIHGSGVIIAGMTARSTWLIGFSRFDMGGGGGGNCASYRGRIQLNARFDKGRPRFIKIIDIYDYYEILWPWDKEMVAMIIYIFRCEFIYIYKILAHIFLHDKSKYPRLSLI